MFPVIFSFGSITIYTSSLIVAIGFFLSLFIFWKRIRVEVIEEEKIFDFILIGIFGAMLVGRLVFILENFNDFGLRIDRAIHIYKYPGFNLWGLFFGGLFFSLLYAQKNKISKNKIYDVLALSFSFFLGCLFLAYFFDGFYVGFTSERFGVPFFGFVGRRFPIQLIGMSLFWIFYIIVSYYFFHFRKGYVFWAFLVYFFTILLILEFFRQDKLYFEAVVLNKFLFFIAGIFCMAVIVLKYKDQVKEDLHLLLKRFKIF